ncbi:hypothetical protein G9U52_36505 [Paenibacillus sp. S3N08]|uniref:Uncharacterized protein n=2 Tax=Paenibacillus agricola TaxID=2716264 RepID=A0ABX0JIF3_9BACL|nr:hypothetical protein [Paenibacillus agricola]
MEITSFELSEINCEKIKYVVLHEVKVEEPYVVDFDADDSPERWLDQWDLKNWCIISAYEKDERIDGCQKSTSLLH